MTLNQIKYFVAIVENHTFLEASYVLNLSQSSLSKSIQRLEEELDVALFDRAKRSSFLTEEGRSFYQGCLKILEAYHESLANLNKVANRTKRRIHLVTLPILSQYGLTKALKEFNTAYPEIELVIDETEDPSVLQSIDENLCDIAVIRKEYLTKDIYKTYPLATDELVLITSLQHPLAGKESVSLSELTNEKFILMPRHVCIHDICIAACKSQGFTPHIARSARLESILSAVSADEGISLVMSKNLDIFHHDQVAIIPLKEKVRSTIVLAANKNQKIRPDVKRLIDWLTHASNSHEY